MPRFHRRAVLGGTSALLISAAVRAVPASAQAGRMLTVAIPTNPSTFDPVNQGNHDAMVVSQLVFENLVEIDADGNRQPALARALPTVSDDKLTYTFDLREDVTFHSGQPFTAEDVKYSFEWVLDPANKALRRPIWLPIASVTALAKDRVEFKLSRPYRPFLDYMTKYMGIFPKGSRETFGPDHFRQTPTGVGTGPATFVSARTNDVVELARNPNHWRKGLPFWDGVRVRIIPEDAARTAALLAGQIAIAGAPSPRDYTRLKAAPNVKSGAKPALGSAMLMVHNTRKAPFDDVHFRRAVSFATDRRTIAEKVCFGLVEASSVPAPTSSWWHDPVAAATLDFNLEKARAALAQSRYARGAEFELLYASQPYLVDVRDTALFLQSRLAELGVTVKLQPLETAQLIGQVALGNQTSALMVVVGPNDPTFILQSLYQEGQVFAKGTGFASPDLDRLIAESMGHDDQASLKPILGRIQALFAEAAPSTWIGTASAYNLWAPQVSGFQPNVGLTLMLRDAKLA